MLSIYDIGGEVVKEDDRYIMKDNTELKNLVVSSTRLHPGKSTTGHKHEGQEEVYNFVSGWGKMQLDDEEIDVAQGDVVLIHNGVFHKVINPSEHDDLYFVCVFEGKRHQ